jgi:hypothetical protein
MPASAASAFQVAALIIHTYIHTCYTCSKKQAQNTMPSEFHENCQPHVSTSVGCKNSSNLPGTACRLPPRTIKGLNQCHNHHDPLPAFDCTVWAIARSTKGAAGRPQAWQELGLADTPLTQRQMHMQAHRQAYIAHELCMACTSSAAIHHMWHLSNVRAGLRCIRRRVPPHWPRAR